MPAAPIIAIDGPSGSGKGTVSRLVADALGWRFLDSGALYRLVALAGLSAGLAPDDVAGHERLARQMQVIGEAGRVFSSSLERAFGDWISGADTPARTS